MLRVMAIISPSEFFTMLLFLILILPSKFDSMNDCSEICAAPPMWKVRMVSWVPGLADRLGGDDAHRLADIDRRAAGQIAAVALAANAGDRLAGEHRADAHLLHAGRHDRLDLRLLEQGAAS